MLVRRRQITLAALGGLAVPRLARAQAGDWPNRPVRLVVPSAPAGSADVALRSLAEKMSSGSGKVFFVENRAGLAGTIGVDNIVKGPPDGYSYVFISTNAAVNETLQPRRPFVLTRDLAPVAAVNSLPLIFAVDPNLPVRSLPEFIAYAKARPGELNFASSGPGSMFHLSTEVLAAMAGIRMTHVPFRNYGEARTALMGGQIQLMADATFTLEPLISGGRMRALATTRPQRTGMFPDVQTVAETLPGYDMSLWNGLIAHAATPRAIVERMNEEVNKALADPAFIEANRKLDITLTPMTPAAYGELIARDVDRMREAVRVAKVDPE